MPEEQLRSVIDGIRARLQAELESHFGTLAQSHEQAVQEARRGADAEAEQRWSAKLEAAQAEWGSRLQSEIESTRAEAQRAHAEAERAHGEVQRAYAEESARLRTEAQQATAEAAVQARREIDEAVAAERARAQADLERAQAERERAHAELGRAQADLERVQADRERADADRVRAQEDLQRAQSERERTQEDLQRAQAERAQAQDDLQRTQADRAQAQGDLQRAQAERARAQEDLQQAHAERERTHADLLRVQAEQAQAQDDLQRAHADRERVHQDVQRLHANGEQTRQDLERAHGDRERTQADLQRAHAELERAQQDLERAHAALERAQTELQQSQSQSESFRQQAARELDQARHNFEAERMSAANALADAHQTAASMPRDASELLVSLRAIDEAPSLTMALAAAVRGAALESPRAALFVVNGATLQEWPVDGVPPVDSGPIRSTGREAGFLAEVLKTGETETIDGTNGQVAPMFAGLSPGRRAIAVPFVLDGQPVAVLYADEGSDGEPLGSWLETVQIIGRHAASVVASITAVKTAQALRLIGSGARNGQGGAESNPPEASAHGGVADDEAQSARRYAKLLVSEIKLYNEGAVRVGRERRDLGARLRDEIDRARRLYEQRVSSSLHGREQYFDQELIQTLADGDRTLFG